MGFPSLSPAPSLVFVVAWTVLSHSNEHVVFMPHYAVSQLCLVLCRDVFKEGLWDPRSPYMVEVGRFDLL